MESAYWNKEHPGIHCLQKSCKLHYCHKKDYFWVAGLKRVISQTTYCSYHIDRSKKASLLIMMIHHPHSQNFSMVYFLVDLGNRKSMLPTTILNLFFNWKDTAARSTFSSLLNEWETHAEGVVWFATSAAFCGMLYMQLAVSLFTLQYKNIYDFKNHTKGKAVLDTSIQKNSQDAKTRSGAVPHTLPSGKTNST